jgi:hypothetical protein
MVADLPLEKAQLLKAVEALQQFAAEQQALYDFDLSNVDPAFSFDPRWG